MGPWGWFPETRDRGNSCLFRMPFQRRAGDSAQLTLGLVPTRQLGAYPPVH